MLAVVLVFCCNLFNSISINRPYRFGSSLIHGKGNAPLLTGQMGNIPQRDVFNTQLSTGIRSPKTIGSLVCQCIILFL